jgi:L-lactate dehydrogenase complex protein LldG
MTAARDEILNRIRRVERPATPQVQRSYRQEGALSPAGLVARLRERVSDYRADVRVIDGSDVAVTIASACADRGACRLGIPPALPSEWRPGSLELVEDTGLDPRALDELDGAITGSTVAIAETGTIVLTGGLAEGRRSLTLVPDLHVCVVLSPQIVELVPEAFVRLDAAVREKRPITFVSGPSATSDIELSRVEGVHGPRDLVVLIVKETQ